MLTSEFPYIRQGLADAPYSLEAALEKAAEGLTLSRVEMQGILELSDPAAMQDLFRVARKVRTQHFGNRVFLYGFVYFSTYCGNNCRFCFYRRQNTSAPRYRKSLAQITEAAQGLRESGVHLIDLTMGEDPEFGGAGDQGLEDLLQTVRSVKEATHLPIMLSAGVLPETALAALGQAGANWYACYQETHQRSLFQRLRTGQDYDVRINSKRRAKALGLLIEEGLLLGVGESNADVVNSMFEMQALRADQLRVMGFVPQAGTPMEGFPRPDPARELRSIALLRLVFPDCLIPASLDVGGHAGLQQKLAAGANVVTSLIPPGQGLAGVAQSALDIEDGKRTVAGIQGILRESQLEPASQAAYQSWVDQRRRPAKC